MQNFRGYLEPSRFRVSITSTPAVVNPTEPIYGPQLEVPTFKTGGSIDTWAARGFYCHNAQLPSKQFQTTETVIYGPDRKMPYRTQYQDFTCSFYVATNSGTTEDAQMVLDYFNRWQSAIIDNNHDLEYHDNYVTDIDVDVYSRKGTGIPGVGSVDVRLPQVIGGDPLAELSFFKSKELKPIHSITIQGAYPMTVDAVPLDWTNDGIMSVNVTFAYFLWKPKVNPNVSKVFTK